MADQTPRFVQCPVRVHAQHRPDAVLLDDGTKTITYGQADVHLATIGTRLEAAGVQAGDRVALIGDTSIQYVLALLAMWRSGIVACPLNTRRPSSWLEEYTHALEVRLLVSDGSFRMEIGPDVRVDELIAPASAMPRSPARIPLDAPALVVATSGSTANPKAALLTYGNLYYSALGSNENIAVGPGDAWVLSLPLFHVSGIGIVLRCVAAGATMLIDRRGPPRAVRMDGREATHLSLVPTQLHRILREEAGASTRGAWKAVLLGGAAAPASLVEEAVSAGVPLFVSYGLTEMASQVTTTAPSAGVAALHTAGRLLRHRELATSESGEILVRGRTLFAGYVAGGRVIRAVDDDGWYHTGDRGWIDDEGNLHVIGRTDNLFVSGGENVQPEEIEQALLEIQGVQSAVVVPVTDEEFGQRPAAFVRMQSGSPDEQAIRSALRPRLPGFMIPVGVFDYPGEAEEGLKPDRRALERLAAERIREGR